MAPTAETKTLKLEGSEIPHRAGLALNTRVIDARHGISIAFARNECSPPGSED